MRRASTSGGRLTDFPRTRSTRQLVGIAILLLGSTLARAQTIPDAGSVLRQIEQQRHNPLPPKAAPEFVPPPPLQSLGGATMTVKAFRFAGNSLLTNNQLAPSVARYLNHPIDFAELQNAAIAVANAYRRAGWVVRVYLPQQDVTGGTVTIQVVEAKFGAVHVEGAGKRVSSGRISKIVETAQQPGKPVNADSLDRAILLVNDLPAISATGRLTEGQNQSETDLALDVVDGAPVTGDINVDNAGARFTGAGRVIADASLNDRLGLGDRADATLLHSQGSDYQRLAYSLAAGSRGLRVGVNASHLNYKIVTSEFEALDANGSSTTVGLDASYPILRSRLKNLYVAVDADNKHFDNDSASQTTTRYTVRTVSLSLYGNLFDTLGGGGANTASVAVIQGNADLSDSPNEAADALTARTAGSFRKYRFSASRLQVITPRVALFASVSAQLTNKNVDSSERFYLGGSQGVRAYPEDEGGGSEGALLNFEARSRLVANFDATAFIDWGTVRVNKDNDFTGAATRNSQQLKGTGVSFGWVAKFGLSLKATYAHRIGSNPNPTLTGDDQDGSLVKNRVWLQASMPF